MLERSVWAHYTDPYRDSSIVLFMRKGEPALYPLKSLLDLAGTDFRLGVGRVTINIGSDEDPNTMKELVKQVMETDPWFLALRDNQRTVTRISVEALSS